MRADSPLFQAIKRAEESNRKAEKPSAASAGYDAWVAEVERLCDSFGLPFDAMNDADWREFFDDVQTPYDAVKGAFSE